MDSSNLENHLIFRLRRVFALAAMAIATTAATRATGRALAGLHQRPVARLNAAATQNNPRTLAASLAARFHRRFRIRFGKHFTIIYDTTPLFAAQRMAYLDRAYHAVMFFFRLPPLIPRPPKKRIVCLLFAKRSTFLSYARAADNADMAWAAGYYSQRTNRIAFYNDAGGRAAGSIDKATAKMRHEVKNLGARIHYAIADRLPDLADRLARRKSHLMHKIIFYHNYAHNVLREINAEKTMHEATHAVSFNTGLQKRGVDYPFWLNEGLATSIEATGSPTRVNRGRRTVFRKAVRSGSYFPLAKLIAFRPTRHTTIKKLVVAYGESWAFFYYCYARQRPALTRLFRAYKAQTPGKRISDRRTRALFIKCFGNKLSLLQERFLRYMRWP